MELLSPAKINLFLQVVGKRPTGFHELATTLQAISLCDTLSITAADSDSLTCDDPSLPTDGRNLILKAADLFRKKSGLSLFIHCHLEKRIPSQAGLGGGSGNAATTLWAMNVLAGSPATNAELLEWSADIGSDIPFFFSTGAAYCTGRGEFVSSCKKPFLQAPITIAKPDCGICTASCFKELQREEWSQYDPLLALKELQEGKQPYYNDLEAPALRLQPELARFRSSLSIYKPHLSGSGSAFWCEEIPPELPHYKPLMRSLEGWYEG